jgi:hypothetical protein
MPLKSQLNEIERIGYLYSKKSGIQVTVKPSCIKDNGKLGKGLKLILKCTISWIKILNGYNHITKTRFFYQLS